MPSNADARLLEEIFTRKQLCQLSIIKNSIDNLKDSPEKNVLLIIFCSALTKANLCYDLPDDGRGLNAGQFSIFSTGRYRIPKQTIEISAYDTFRNRAKRIIEAKKETNKYINAASAKDLRAEICSATDLKKYLKDNK